MLRWVVAGMSVGSACAVFAEEPEHTEDPPTIVALEVTVAPDAPIRMMDGERYETYLRTLLRGLAPKTPIVSEGPDERVATHWICTRFGAGATPRVVAVTLEVQTVGAGVRQTVRELSSTVELPIGEPEAVERFLRSEATRVVASGVLWQVPEALPQVPTRRSGSRPEGVGTASQLRPEHVATEVRPSARHATPVLRRPYRSFGAMAAGLGLSLLAGGVWQGMLARREEAAFDAATTQRDAADAKAVSERHARYANALYASGAALTVAGVTVVTLDALGVIGRPRRDPTYPAVAIVPVAGGAFGMWSAPFP